MIKHFTSEYFDEEYFSPSRKSSFIYPYIWDVEGPKSLQEADNLIKTFSPRRVLDVGCGKGFLIKAFMTKGVYAEGCDISKWAIDNCEPEVKGKLKYCDIRDGLSQYDDDSFDLLVCEQILEHIEIEFLPVVIQELFRVTSNWVHVGVPISLTRNNEPFGDPTHVTYMSYSFWVSIFFKYGFLADQRSRISGKTARFSFTKKDISL